MIRKSNLYIRFLLVLLFQIIAVFSCFSQNKQKNILVIHSYHIGYAWTDSIAMGVVSVMNKAEDVNLFVEYLDGKRHDDSLYMNEMYKVYQSKYKLGMIDMVILSDNLALEFSLKYGQKLYGNVPVIFCGINNPEHYKLADIPYYGILETEVDEAVLKQIIALLPKLENIYLISDKTQNGLADMTRIQQFIKRLPSNINYQFINDIDVDSLFMNMKSIKSTDAVFLISLQRDRYGNALNYGRTTSQLCAVSPAPVFCSYFSNIGKGVVGGCFVNAVTQGRLSAETALKLLKDPTYKPEKLIIPKPEYYFDYHVLERFSISKSQLPKDRIIVNEPDSIFEKYKKVIITIIVIIVFLLLVIALLANNIQRRIKAEKVVQSQYRKIQHQNEQISLVNQNLNDTNAELEISNETLSAVNSELVVAKEHAEESDKLKTAFLQNMSHEIRTPMHAIMSFSQLLIGSFNNKDELQKLVFIINKHCNDLLVIINDILDIAKLESGQLSVDKEVFSVNELFVELDAFFRKQQEFSDKSHLALNIHCDDDIQLVSDKAKLKQILINLLSNALKFTENGTIEISCIVDKEVGRLFFSVSDTGIGISVEKQAVIFDRFTQVEDSNTRLYGGIGLGLPIVKGLVNLLGGDIWVESQLEKGSTFSFTIPITVM